MSTQKILFSDPDIKLRIMATIDFLRGSQTDSSSLQEVAKRLSMVLDIVVANAEAFDEKCQFNIEHIGSAFTQALVERGVRSSNVDSVRLSVLLLRFVIEYDLSVANNLAPELENFIHEVGTNPANYSPEMKAHIDYAHRKMPIAIMKQLLNSEDFVGLRNVQLIAKNTGDRVKEWEASLQFSEARVEHLQAVLSTQEQHFNFVGLSKGFSDLGKKIEDELAALQTRLVWFGVLLLVPVLLEFTAISSGWINSSASAMLLGTTAVASVTATLLLLYFFRITLHNADSCRAQLVQIRLRMALCQFIQSYAAYSTEIKAKNADALSKFENLIFSGIVNKDDKLPSTFDGIAQLGGLLNNLRATK